MGFFLPPNLQRGEAVPTRTQCEADIYGEMVKRCVVKGGKDLGAVNVRVLPDKRSDGMGVLGARPRFLVAGERLG